MKIRIGRLLGLCVVFSLAACNTQGSAPNPPPSGSPAGSGLAPAPASIPPKESADTWLVVSKDGVELGVIELRAGKPPSLTAEGDTPAVAELKAKLAAIGGPNGIGLDMHMPEPGEKGRGAYGTRIVKYDDRLYKHALKNALEPTFSAKEVLHVIDPLPPAGFKRVQISRSGEKVGTLDFSGTPPKLTVVDAEKADGMSLKNTWERIEKLAELKVRYHVSKGSTETLVTDRAKPGDANYAEVAIVYMMVENYYLTRYAYKLEFSQ